MRITLPTLPSGRMFEQISITSSSDGRNRIRYQMEVEHCIRGDG